ncbi:MAG TPA: hypothetical protein VFA82_03035 [Gaiellaceae bacterium]|nr:hypothetical protein [Gaiellaceae bacterium]
MKPLLIVVTTLAAAALAAAGSTQAGSSHRLRVDRPARGTGARVTYVQLVRGIVAHRMRATILTDTRCTPDMMGVSHCLNRMRLANGETITVVHNHRMMDMPCLDPGEHVVVTP